MAVFASTWVNWSALWKIFAVSMLGGVGVVLVFGILLFGVKFARNAKTGGREWAGYVLSGVCAVICVGAFAVGIYAMAEKPASKAKKTQKESSKSAAIYARPAPSQKLIASAP
jgi:hypothetical protein